MYRVETFIIPTTNQCNTEISVNEIDDIKVANKLTAQETTVSSLVLSNSFNNSYNDQHNNQFIHEYDESLTQDTDEQKEKSMILSELTCNETKLDKSADRLTDYCYHGYKNGCTVSALTPEKISEEVFKQNWLRKLEALRQREAILNDKEIALECRERLLLKKEKELQILEKLVQSKVKQARIYLKQCSDIHKSESNNNTEEDKTSESRSSNGSRNSNKKNSEHSNTRDCSEKSYRSKESIDKSTDRERKFNNNDQFDNQKICDSIISGHELQNPQNSEVSATSSMLHLCTGLPRNRSTKQFSYRSAKFRTRPKISYDDLDSTLSADPGDSSFIRTSKIFDPEAYKKPFVFANSNCEQRLKRMNTKEISTLSTIKETIQNPVNIEEEKVIKRITENISAFQDGTTKYQDYGLIDEQKSSNTSSRNICDAVIYDEKKYSYLDLETGWKNTRMKSGKALKERPMSWNKETDDWLRKKRLAYNLSIRRTQTKNSEDKENVKVSRKESKADNATEKPVKKKNIRSKMFNVFR